MDNTSESLDRAAARERVEFAEVMAEVVAVVIVVVEAAAAEWRARLAVRVVGPEEEEEGTAGVDASARFRLLVSIQNPFRT